MSFQRLPSIRPCSAVAKAFKYGGMGFKPPNPWRVNPAAQEEVLTLCRIFYKRFFSLGLDLRKMPSSLRVGELACGSALCCQEIEGGTPGRKCCIKSTTNDGLVFTR